MSNEKHMLDGLFVASNQIDVTTVKTQITGGWYQVVIGIGSHFTVSSHIYRDELKALCKRNNMNFDDVISKKEQLRTAS